MGLLSKVLSQAGPDFAGKLNEGIAQSLGESVGQKVAAVVGRVVNKVHGKPTATEAVQDVAKAPDDADAQAALRLQLKKLMEEDDTFAQDLKRLLEEAKPEAERAGISIVVSGSGAAATSGGAAAGQGGVAVVGDVHGGVGRPSTSTGPDQPLGTEQR